MENIIYQNTIVQRGTIYYIQIIKKAGEFVLALSLESGEKPREFPITNQSVPDQDNYSVAEIFREAIEAEERWIKDNR